jgi:hypothetical protein
MMRGFGFRGLKNHGHEDEMEGKSPRAGSCVVLLCSSTLPTEWNGTRRTRRNKLDTMRSTPVDDA